MRRSTRLGLRLLCAILFGLAAIAPTLAAERIVSLNLCTDQMLVLLAPEKIAALSILARDPALSFVAEQARAFPVVRASAETVLRFDPDLVLAGRFGAQTTAALLERHGVPILRTDLPRDFEAIRVWVRSMAAVLGRPDRAETAIQGMDATLAAIPPPPTTRSAIAMQPRGYTAGPGSTMDAAMMAAGLTNVSDGRRLSLESLARHPPDLLVLPLAPTFPSLATAMLDSRVVRAFPRRRVPPAWTICAGPFTARAAALLAR